MPSHGRRADAGDARDLLQGCVGAVGRDLVDGHGEDARVVAPGVGALSGVDGHLQFTKRRGPPYYIG